MRMLAAKAMLVTGLWATQAAAQGEIPPQPTVPSPGAARGYSWPRYREYRDFAGQGYTDMTPTGRRGYMVPLPSPGFDDMGNGPSMAYSPIFNAPGAGPNPNAPPRPGRRGLLGRLFGR